MPQYLPSLVMIKNNKCNIKSCLSTSISEKHIKSIEAEG